MIGLEYFKRASHRLVSKIAVMLLCLFATGNNGCPKAQAVDRDLYLLWARPCDEMLGGRPYPTILLRLTSNGNQLDSMWSIEETRIASVRAYADVGSLLLLLGHPPPMGIQIISMADALPTATYSFDELGTVLAVSQYSTGVPLGHLSVTYTHDALTPGLKRMVTGVTPANIRSGQLQSMSEPKVGELRIAGARGARFGGESDIVPLKNITMPSFQSLDSSILLSAFPVPVNVVTFKTSFGWTLFAHEQEFLAAHSIPERNGLTQTEILIYNRDQGAWASILVPGNETPLRPLNEWIVGEVCYSSPRTDWVRRIGDTPLISDSSVIIDPLTLKMTIADLGPDSEVLWIESDTVYYRSGESLYKARIGDTDLIDRQLILTDPRVKHIHWAFRGGEAIE